MCGVHENNKKQQICSSAVRWPSSFHCGFRFLDKYFLFYVGRVFPQVSCVTLPSAFVFFSPVFFVACV